jgi:DNA ligase 1
MASPSKRRKVDKDNKSSPVSSRNLDYFFSKQKQDIASRDANGATQERRLAQDAPRLTDEELAKKLQAEWDQEATSSTTIPSSSATNVPTSTQTQPDGQTQNLNGSAREPEEEDIYGAEDIFAKKKVKTAKSGGADVAKSKDTLSLQSGGSAEDTISSTIPFDESPLTFDPTKYVTELQKHWVLERSDASYALLTRCFVLVNSTQSRIKIVDTLVNFLRTIIEGDPSSLLPAVRVQQEADCSKLPSPMF